MVYHLTQQAYLDGGYQTDESVYHAMAIRESDEPDEEGWQPAYEIEWSILEDFDPRHDDDEGCACDWTNPDGVREIGEYNVAQKRFC